jgi:hypothetical protein
MSAYNSFVKQKEREGERDKTQMEIDLVELRA